MRTLPFTEFHTALYSRLTTDDDTSGYTVYSADAVPLNAAFPYVTIQVVDSDGDDAKSCASEELVFAIKVHTRSEVGEGGMSEAYTMAGNAMKALTRSTLSLGGGNTVVSDRAPTSTPNSYLSDTQAHMHRDVIITGRYRIHTG